MAAVLSDAHAEGLRDFAVAGDLVMNRPEPAKALALIRDLSAPSLDGNPDLEVIRSDDAVAAWTRQQLDQQGRFYLADLPLAHRVTWLGAMPG